MKKAAHRGIFQQAALDLLPPTCKSFYSVREKVSKVMQELYQQLSADLQKSARRSDDRLSALIVKAARSAGIAQRMLLSLAGKLVTPDFATRAYEDAREKAGKDIAKPEG